MIAVPEAPDPTRVKGKFDASVKSLAVCKTEFDELCVGPQHSVKPEDNLYLSSGLFQTERAAAAAVCLFNVQFAESLNIVQSRLRGVYDHVCQVHVGVHNYCVQHGVDI